MAEAEILGPELLQFSTKACMRMHALPYVITYVRPLLPWLQCYAEQLVPGPAFISIL